MLWQERVKVGESRETENEWIQTQRPEKKTDSSPNSLDRCVSNTLCNTTGKTAIAAV